MENKLSKILIVIGIVAGFAIAIIGGIAFMNEFTKTQKKSVNADSPLEELIKKSERSMNINRETIPKTLVFPGITIMFGVILIIVCGGISLSHHKNLPPGIG